MSYTHTHRTDVDLRALLRWIAIAVALVAAAVGSVLLFEQRADHFAPPMQAQAFAPELFVTPYSASATVAPPDVGAEPSPLEAFRPDVDEHAATF